MGAAWWCRAPRCACSARRAGWARASTWPAMAGPACPPSWPRSWPGSGRGAGRGGHMAGETNLIRALGRAETAQQQDIGTSALGWAAALLKGDDPLGLQKVQAARADVTIGNATITVNGGAGGQ